MYSKHIAVPGIAVDVSLLLLALVVCLVYVVSEE